MPLDLPQPCRKAAREPAGEADEVHRRQTFADMSDMLVHHTHPHTHTQIKEEIAISEKY